MREDIRLLDLNPNLANLSYASGQVMGSVVEIPRAVLDTKGTGWLESLLILDNDKQNLSFDVVLFDEAPVNSIGADGAAYGLAQADRDKLIGRISVKASSYEDHGNLSEATYSGFRLPIEVEQESKSLFVALVARGAATYTAATSLKLKLGVSQTL